MLVAHRDHITTPQGAIRIGLLAACLAAGIAGALAQQAVVWGGPSLPEVRLQQVVANLRQPVYVTHAGDGSNRLFIVEQPGTIRVLRGGRLLPAPFLDISRRVVAGGEMGLLSVAFHPHYTSNGRFFVNYTAQEDGLKTVIAEYRVSRGNPDVAEPAERIVLEISQPYRNHNGGLHKFGPDGNLYIGTGDGGSGGDPQNHAQRLDTLLGKMLRVGVDGGTPYRVPPDNPFVGRPGARPEIWAYGLRNPWRFSFDRVTGRLFVADVGQNAVEEVHIVERGGNYGWNIMEGSECYRSSSCDKTGLRLPIAEYGHAQGCSVTGGYVYRGSRISGLAGRYIFGDYCSGRLWALTEEAGGRWTVAAWLSSGLAISSFGEDHNGEIYVVDHRGAVYMLSR